MKLLKMFFNFLDRTERSLGATRRSGRAAPAHRPARPFNLLPRLTRIRRCVPAKLKDLLRVPPLLNVLHTGFFLVCVPHYTQYAEITFHMSRNNKGGRKSRPLLVLLHTFAIIINVQYW